MATRVVEKYGAREGDVDRQGMTRLSRTFVVTTDRVVDDERTILRTNGLPRRGSLHNVWSGARCTSQQARQSDDNARVWEITYRYETDLPEEWRMGEISGVTPLEKPADVSWSHTEYDVYRGYDRRGEPLVNTVGQRLLDIPPIQETIQILTIVQNQESFDYKSAYSYNNTINSRKWLGFKAQVAKCKISAVSQWELGVSFWRVTYQFLVRADPWNPTKILNRGTLIRQVDATGAVRWTLPSDGDGTKHAEPVNLAENGSALSPTQKPVWLEFDMYEEMDFRGLPVPEIT